MANTTNFGWETPDDTDLVKDGAAAMRTLGNSIDASFVDLKGGTTGQILSKASNTDLDYTWINSNPGDITAVTAGIGISGGGTSGDVTITNSMATAIDAKGDLVAGTGADAFARLAVGTNGQVLQADSTTATGLKWGTIATGPSGWTLLNTGGTALTGASTITVSSISAKQLLILVDDASAVNTFADFRLRFNNDSGANYWAYGIYNVLASTYAAGNFDGYQSAGFDTRVSFAQMGSVATSKVSGYCYVDLADTTGFKRYETASSGDGTGGGNSFQQFTLSGIWSGTAAITSISLVSTGGNFDNGTLYVFGAN